MSNPAIFGRRKDANHDEIASALRECGHSVIDTYRNGQGFPDLLVILRGTQTVVLVEIKMPGEALTKPEKKFHAEYRGRLVVVESVEDAVWKIEGMMEE